MWKWDQSKGALSHDGEFIASGYAGFQKGKNNPAMEAVKSIGPIPRGIWKIESVYDSKNTGPFTLVISACPGTDTHNRSGFRIHGDSIANPGSASHGCIILPRKIREMIWHSGDYRLEVVE